jgi:hypothetical protein
MGNWEDNAKTLLAIFPTFARQQFRRVRGTKPPLTTSLVMTAESYFYRLVADVSV